MKWFRLYNEIIDDQKVWDLSDSEFKAWVGVLCLASKAEAGGDTKLTVSETAWKLRLDVSVTLQKLIDRNLVTLRTNGDGVETVFVPKWKKRQFQSDSSTERVRKHRDKDQ